MWCHMEARHFRSLSLCQLCSSFSQCPNSQGRQVALVSHVVLKKINYSQAVKMSNIFSTTDTSGRLVPMHTVHSRSTWLHVQLYLQRHGMFPDHLENKIIVSWGYCSYHETYFCLNWDFSIVLSLTLVGKKIQFMKHWSY